MYKLIFIVTLAGLVGCAGGPYPVSSPYYLLPAGSRLVLKQTLTIPPNRARVFIQNGKVVSEQEKDQYYAHCWFLSHKVLKTAQKIEPGIFTVIKTRKLENDVRLTSPIKLASLRFIGQMGSDNGVTAIEYTTELNIHSDSQPDIFRFACTRWEDPLDAEHLTVKKIEQTLGDIAKLELASGN